LCTAPNLFKVASGPSEAEFEAALEAVRTYLEEGEAGTASGSGKSAESSGMASPTLASQSAAGPGPAPLSSVAGDSSLQVNGAAVVTTATLAGGVGAQLCLAVDYRYVDLGDGTVLDCNTGKMWLKDADCLGTGTWDNSGTRMPNSRRRSPSHQ
jgi:hypothetical protein